MRNWLGLRAGDTRMTTRHRVQTLKPAIPCFFHTECVAAFKSEAGLAEHLHDHHGYEREHAIRNAEAQAGRVRHYPDLVAYVTAKGWLHIFTRKREDVMAGKIKVITNGKHSNSVKLAQRGVKTTAEFSELMSALMCDAVAQKVTPQIVNAACYAGRNLLRVAELQMRMGKATKGNVVQLALGK
jgi:hypothetical protein